MSEEAREKKKKRSEETLKGMREIGPPLFHEIFSRYLEKQLERYDFCLEKKTIHTKKKEGEKERIKTYSTTSQRSWGKSNIQIKSNQIKSKRKKKSKRRNIHSVFNIPVRPSGSAETEKPDKVFGFPCIPGDAKSKLLNRLEPSPSHCAITSEARCPTRTRSKIPVLI